MDGMQKLFAAQTPVVYAEINPIVENSSLLYYNNIEEFLSTANLQVKNPTKRIEHVLINQPLLNQNITQSYL